MDKFLLDHVVCGHIFIRSRGGFGARLDFLSRGLYAVCVLFSDILFNTLELLYGESVFWYCKTEIDVWGSLVIFCN